MKQVHDNPGVNENLGPFTTYAFVTTGVSGLINTSGVVVSNIEKGQSVCLKLDGGSAGGFVDEKEYYAIPVGVSGLRLATSEANALAGTTNDAASGNAGSGTLYPNYRVGGTIFCKSAGNVNIRGISVDPGNTGLTLASFSLHPVVASQALPYMIKDISSSGTTSTVVGWSH